METKGPRLTYPQEPDIIFPDGPKFKAADIPEVLFEQKGPKLARPIPPRYREREDWLKWRNLLKPPGEK